MGLSMQKMHAYLSELNRAAAASQAGRPAAGAAGAPAGSLHDRFVQWYAALPTLARNRPFAMVEIERALGTRGRFISAVLIRLGWRRQRIWTGAGPFHRYWLPPPG
jgi:hypothetical protein